MSAPGGAEISTENDVPANLHDGPDGAPLISPADAAPMVAGAETGAISINRAQYPKPKTKTPPDPIRFL